MEFNQAVIEWVKLQSEMNQIQKKMKIVKENSDKCEKKILEYMRQNKLENSQIEVDNVKIIYKNISRVESISREFLLQKSIAYFRDDATAKKFIDYIYQNRRNVISNKLCIKNNFLKKSWGIKT
jgi:hypothetical protein